MTKKVLDVGNCDPDHYSLKTMLAKRYDVELGRAHLPADALAKIQSEHFDLVLINRKLDADYSDGVEILKAIKQNPTTAGTPVMILTNYQDQQELAVSLGAELGFGKLQYGESATHEKLARYLDPK